MTPPCLSACNARRTGFVRIRLVGGTNGLPGQASGLLGQGTGLLGQFPRYLCSRSAAALASGLAPPNAPATSMQRLSRRLGTPEEPVSAPLILMLSAHQTPRRARFLARTSKR